MGESTLPSRTINNSTPKQELAESNVNIFPPLSSLTLFAYPIIDHEHFLFITFLHCDSSIEITF